MKKFLLPILLLFTALTTAQQVTTFAGTYLGSGYLDGDVSTAMFQGLKGICSDTSGNIYLVDGFNQKIRKISTSGIVTTIAGSTEGFEDGIGTAAKFNYPVDICINTGNTHLFVTDAGNHKIRKIEITTGVVTTFAGSTVGYVDGLGEIAKFNDPNGICIGANDVIYVTEWLGRKIRSISPSGVVNTIAGSTWGYVDAIGTSAQFKAPLDVCIDSFGNLYITDSINGKIRKISPNGMVTTIAGSTFGQQDGQLLQAQFKNPVGICIDTNDNLYVTDNYSHNIRKINLTTGIVSTFVGSTIGVDGNMDGLGTQALIRDPNNLCIIGNNLYFVSLCCGVVKKVTGGILEKDSFDNMHNILYPNPTNGSFTIETPNAVIFKVSIYDILGRMVFTENTNTAFTYTFNKQVLEKGMYKIVVVTENGSFFKSLLVN